jgi:hypothetical protein
MTAFPSYHRATCPSERGLDEVPRGLVVRRMDSFSAAKKTPLCGTPLDAAMLRLKHDPSESHLRPTEGRRVHLCIHSSHLLIAVSF